jgi:hypothetical protein
VINKSTVRRLAETIKLIYRIGDGYELVYMLGEGTERNNQEALETWIGKKIQGIDQFDDRDLIKHLDYELEKAMDALVNSFGH